MTETNIVITQYRPGGMVHYTLKVTDGVNEDFHYDGDALTIGGAMACINETLDHYYPEGVGDGKPTHAKGGASR